MNSLIADIEKVDLECESAYEELFCLFSRKIVPMHGYKLLKERTPSLIRSRINECFVDYCEFKNVSYPPSEKILEYSRANKPLQNLLYVSDRFDTNLSELKLLLKCDLLDNDIIWVTTGTWILNEDLQVAIVPDFTNATMQKHFMESLTSDEYTFYSFLSGFFRKEANCNKSIYKITSAYCNAVFSKCHRYNQRCDGVMFTSVQAGFGFNIALKPFVVDDKKISLEYVIKSYIRKSTDSDNIPVIDNFLEPIKAIKLDHNNERIIWKEKN